MPLISGQAYIAGTSPHQGLSGATVTCDEGKTVTMGSNGNWTCWVTNTNTYHFTAECSGYQTAHAAGTSAAPVDIPMTPV